jgi:hypothetical protein
MTNAYLHNECITTTPAERGAFEFYYEGEYCRLTIEDFKLLKEFVDIYKESKSLEGKLDYLKYHMEKNNENNNNTK